MYQQQKSRLTGTQKIAVLRANALGDFIFTLPALEALGKDCTLEECEHQESFVNTVTLEEVLSAIHELLA